MNNRPNFIVAAALAWIFIIGFVLLTDGGQTVSAQDNLYGAPSRIVDGEGGGGEGGFSPSGNPPALAAAGDVKPKRADKPLYLQNGAGGEPNPTPTPVQPVDLAGSTAKAGPAVSAEAVAQADPAAFAAPYDNYVMTQGVHGEWYGHMAIDIAAGKGADILSPINGTVSDKFVDQWGNPNLIIENEVYTVTMMHGEYTAGIGDPLLIGTPVGAESNQGYTLDWQGNSCAGRDCGYHTHLNVYDKRAGSNVDPSLLIGR